MCLFSCHIRYSLSPSSFYYTSTYDLYTVCRTKAAVFHPPCVHARQYPDDLLQHFHKRCFSSAVGGLWVWFTKHAHWPCELAPVTLLPLCLSPPRLDHTAPVTTVLALPTGYNYSAFCCSPFFLSLSLSRVFSVSLSLSSAGSWHRGPGRGPQGRCFVFTTRWTPLTAPWLWTGGGWWCERGKGKGRRGGVTHWMPRPLGWRGGGGGGVVGEDLLPSNPPTRLPFSVSISSFLFHLLSLSLSVPGLQAGRSSRRHHFLVPLPAGGGMLQSCPPWRK